MTTPPLMPDERLAQLEEAAQHQSVGGWRFVGELVAEVRRLRRGGKTLGEIIDRQLWEIVDLTESRDIIGEDGDGDWSLVWERLHQIRADRDAANARVAELEREIDQLKLAREHPHSAKLASRVLRAEDDRDRARSIAAALEQENAQLQARARSVLDERDRLQDQMLRVRELADDDLRRALRGESADE